MTARLVRAGHRVPALGLLALVVLALFGPASARADLGSLEAACKQQDAADGNVSNGARLPFVFCDDGVPPTGGTTPNQGAASAIAVPERYAGFAGLPARATPDPGSGADTNGDIALDADVSLPDPSLNPPPPDGYPLIVLMHTCCSGDKHNFEASTIDGSGELWHYNNAWFAARGYVVLNYTSRGFVDGSGHGSTGQMQLDSRRYEVNDFQEKVVLAKIPWARFHREALPGEQLIYDVEILHLRPEGAAVAGKVSSDDELIVEAEIFFAHLDKSRSQQFFGDQNFVFSGELKHLLGLVKVLADRTESEGDTMTRTR